MCHSFYCKSPGFVSNEEPEAGFPSERGRSCSSSWKKCNLEILYTQGSFKLSFSLWDLPSNKKRHAERVQDCGRVDQQAKLCP